MVAVVDVGENVNVKDDDYYDPIVVVVAVVVDGWNR